MTASASIDSWFLYATDKLFLAAKELATNPHNVKTRLIVAYNKHLFHLALKGDLKPYLDSIHKRMTAKGRLGPRGAWPSAAHYTLHRMHKKTAAKIARDIFDLYVEMERRCELSARQRRQPCTKEKGPGH